MQLQLKVLKDTKSFIEANKILCKEFKLNIKIKELWLTVEGERKELLNFSRLCCDKVKNEKQEVKNKMKKNKKEIVVAISGGFDPIHIGHINLIKQAKKLGDKLVVIINNDNWLKAKKGFVFMNEKARATILYENKNVDWVHITKHKKLCFDMSVKKELQELKPDVFANGGDRFADNVPEKKLCQDLGIKMVFNVGGKKIESSSELVKKAKNNGNE